eukprot:Rhum_TRINITY_DN12832_c1_g2::Rhum_TRINITY_DN12832_c1_g2_i1::g.54928::m.54928
MSDATKYVGAGRTDVQAAGPVVVAITGMKRPGKVWTQKRYALLCVDDESNAVALEFYSSANEDSVLSEKWVLGTDFDVAFCEAEKTLTVTRSRDKNSGTLTFVDAPCSAQPASDVFSAFCERFSALSDNPLAHAITATPVAIEPLDSETPAKHESLGNTEGYASENDVEEEAEEAEEAAEKEDEKEEETEEKKAAEAAAVPQEEGTRVEGNEAAAAVTAAAAASDAADADAAPAEEEPEPRAAAEAEEATAEEAAAPEREASPEEVLVAEEEATREGVDSEQGVQLARMACFLEAQPPAWVDDKSSCSCSVCSNAFTRIRRRRHHCRSCGHLVCSDCSNEKPLAGKPSHLADAGKAARVCSLCHGIAEQIAVEQPAEEPALKEADVTEVAQAAADTPVAPPADSDAAATSKEEDVKEAEEKADKEEKNTSDENQSSEAAPQAEGSPKKPNFAHRLLQRVKKVR